MEPEQPATIPANNISQQSQGKEVPLAVQKLNPQLVKKYQEVFQSFEKEQDSGLVLTKDIPAMMRVLGVTVTEQEIIDMLGEQRVNKQQNPLISSKIDFIDFLSLFIEKENEIAMKEELMEAFRVFDTDGIGNIPVSQLRYYLRIYGISMPEDEVEDLLKDSQPQDGIVKYQKFIDKLLGLNQQAK